MKDKRELNDKIEALTADLEASELAGKKLKDLNR